jgi:hypothetical protein
VLGARPDSSHAARASLVRLRAGADQRSFGFHFLDAARLELKGPPDAYDQNTAYAPSHAGTKQVSTWHAATNCRADH